MSTKFGQKLIKDKVVTKAQLDEAVQAQVIFGGKLGTNLVELNFISLSRLSEALSKEFNVPTIDPASIKPCSEKALDLLGVKLASKYKCVPLALDGSRLDLLMENPANLEAIDDISFATSKRINPYIAPELVILPLMEKYYDIPQGLRYIHLYDAETKETEPAQAPPPQPPAPPPHIDDGILNLEDLVVPEILELEELVHETPVIEVAEAETQVPSAPIAEDEEEEILEELEIIEDLPEALTLQEARDRLGKVENRDELSQIVLAFALGYFKRVGLFITRHDTAMGWDGLGGSVNRNGVQSIMLPLNAPSIFKTVYDTQAFYLGAVPKTPLNDRFLKLMGGEKPNNVFLIPILFKGKVVNIIYGDNGDGQSVPFDISDLLILAPKIPQAFEDIIRKYK
ncbi:MAG: hypothetical protein IMF07_02645 [Proteobacteria bacterium]|nr:hypothetical protein [Pseudomonadota bacterium]